MKLVIWIFDAKRSFALLVSLHSAKWEATKSLKNKNELKIKDHKKELSRKLHVEEQNIEEKLVSINNAKSVLTKRGDMNVNRALETVIEMIGDDDSQNSLPEVSKNDMNSVRSVLSKWNENIKA